MVYEKIVSRRTIRKYAPRDIPREVLVRCVDAARLSPSGANRQPLKYIIVDDEKVLKPVFKTLRWAGYLSGYEHKEEETPRAYIVILLDKKISSDPGHDAGIAGMSISMVAYDEGLGSCILGAIDREKLRKVLDIPNSLDIVLVVSLGYPAEKSIVENMKNGDVRYWVDEKGTFHVPKRSLEDIVRWNGYP